MSGTTIIPAIGSPLTEAEKLHTEGLARQFERLHAAGIRRFFVGGTLGVMPLLTDQTYRELVRRSIDFRGSDGELLVGAGDTSFARTRERIAFLNEFRIDGAVVLAPFFMRFGQAELRSYFHALADESRAPLYLYDLPQRTNTHLETETILDLARHPNIAGIKCSGPIEQSVRLVDTLNERQLEFRVIVANPDLLHMLVRHGIREHLDGIFTLAPRWTSEIARCANASDDSLARQHQRDLTQLRQLVQTRGGMSALSVIMNACGVPGNFAPRPFPRLSPEQEQDLLSHPVVRKLIDDA